MKMETKQEHAGIKVGDLITTYHKGFWRLETIEVRRVSDHDIHNYPSLYKDIEEGTEKSPLFHYVKVFDEKGKLSKGKNACDATFCKPAKEHIDKLLNDAKNLEKLYLQLETKDSTGAHIECYSATSLFINRKQKTLIFEVHIHVYSYDDYEFLKWMERYDYLDMRGNEIKLFLK